MAKARDLADYRRKRDFRKTPEPAGRRPGRGKRRFVVQKHAARRLHYDLRLELGGVLKSWAVTKGPSLDPSVRRLAVHVEDHPVEYADFEGTIPKGEYGAGAVIVWDRGIWVPMGDPDRDYERGHLKFRLSGDRLNGGWALVRMKRRDEGRDNWLLIKERDSFARPGEGDVLLETAVESVLTGRTLESLRSETGLSPAGGRKRRRSRALDPARVAGAKKAELPRFVEPELATSRPDPPEGDDWHHEIKLDGYRTLARIDGQDVRLLTRNGLDWTTRYGDLSQALRGLPCRTALIDGEIVVQDARGVTSFAALQDALSEGRSGELLFYAFDLLHLDGFDLRPARLVDRRAALRRLVEPVLDAHSPIQWSESVRGRGREFFDEACRFGVEGIVSKRGDAPYRSGRSRSWVKVKRIESDEFRIIGFTESDAAGGLGALVLAEETESGLRYAGKVGTGFSAAGMRRLVARLRSLRRPEPALPRPRQLRRERVVWVEPVLTCEVEYRTRTTDGLLRQPSYKGLREDRTAKSSPERPKRERRRHVSEEDLASVWVTNPDRIMFGGPTKLDLALYYARIGDWILPQLVNRPLSIVRCPTGEEKDCFFQKHASPGMPDSVRTVRLREETTRRHADFLYVADARGLLSLAQFGTVEFHPWSCRIDRPERPDRLILDLDPGDDVSWRTVVGAAFEIREVLRELDLVPFVKTTGGRGVHVVVPLRRRHGWKEVLRFSRGLAGWMATRRPDRFTAGLAKRQRRGRIFIDYLRNARGSTAVGAWSLRARPGAPVAMPLAWEELATVDDPSAFDYALGVERMRDGNDPWEEMDASARILTATMVREVERRNRRRGG